MSEVEITRSASIVSDPSLADVFILKRGEMANLTRIDPTLKRIMVGVGWDVIGFEGEAPDLDVSLFMLDKNDKTAADEDFVFYNNLKMLMARLSIWETTGPEPEMATMKIFG